jgi:tetratricopeptide (TPR) repeat protein
MEVQGKYEVAEEMYRRELEGCEKVLGTDHLDTLTSVNNMAILLQGQGKYEAAEEMYRRPLEGREKILGPEHPSTLRSMEGLSNCLKAMKNT